MRCPEIRAFLHPFLDGELDVEKNVVVLQHLELCGCCRDRFEGEKRLLVRVREGISERCPDSLRARIAEACSRIPCGTEAAANPAMPITLARPRRKAASWARAWPRLAASAAAVGIVFLGLDPFCIFGCSTVRALTREHRLHHDDHLPLTGSDAEVGAQLAALTGERVEVPHFCTHCCGHVACEGGQPIKIGDSACIIRFRDEQKRALSFVQARGVSIHPMLRGQDGLYVAHDGDCCFVGWREDSGELCGFVADEPTVPVDRLIAFAANERARESSQPK